MDSGSRRLGATAAGSVLPSQLCLVRSADTGTAETVLTQTLFQHENRPGRLRRHVPTPVPAARSPALVTLILELQRRE